MSSLSPAETTHDLTVASRTAALTRLADYIELTKPKIAVLALVTVAVGYTLGSAGNWQLAGLVNALLGIGLVAASSSALNQWIERTTDIRMTRTANRPLPAGRLNSTEALMFGLACGLAGFVYLAVFVNVTTAALALLTWLLYVAVYTPLKTRTSLCTAVGAVPGALPPVLGWTAAGGALDSGAFALFAILFLWQFPHFLAIAWLYRNEYAAAGLRMLPDCNPRPRVTGMMGVAYATALIPVSLLPEQFAMAGRMYVVVAVVLGGLYLFSALRFTKDESPKTARILLWTSLAYLPLLLLTLTWDHLQLLQ